MLSKHESAKTLQRLFRRSRVVEIDALYRTLKTRSRMSVFRRLRHFNYLTSYSHAGGFYTLTEIPRFDENGLWRYGDIGFSKAGTLKNTIAHLVGVGDAGRTQGELRQLLRVRVHDTALHLVREERIDRQRIEKKYLYVSAEAERAAEQIAARRELLATATAVAVPLPPSTIIEILLEVINASQAWVAPAIVADRLTGRGLTVSTEQVEVVFTDYGLDPEKKNGGLTLAALGALRQHVDCLETHWHRRILDTSGIHVVADEDPGPCPICGGPMGVEKTWEHGGKTARHGPFRVCETVHICRARCRHPSGDLVRRRPESVTRILMPRRIAGYDIMAFAGLQRYLHHRQRDEIRTALLDKYGVDFSAGEVSALVKKFLQYLERLHKAKHEKIRKALADDGGYPLHVDATGEDGQGTLLVALAGWRRWVLDAWKIPTERTEVIHPALRSVTDRFGPPCAAVRDLGKAMIPAVKQLVDELVEERGVDIPILSCHQHFLSDIGKGLLDGVHSDLRALFRHFKVRSKLAALARDLGCKLGEQIAKVRKEVEDWQECDEDGHVVPEGRAGLGAVRSLAQWVLDYKADTGDSGFPFDRPYQAFYDRCISMRRAIDAYYRTPPTDKSVLRTLGRLRCILDVVVSESDFTDVTRRLRNRISLFDELRDALRIVPKQDGRNVQPPRQPLSVEEAAAELNDVRQAVETFVISLQERRPKRGPAQDMREAIDIILKHMDDHGDTLWGHVVRVSMPQGEVVRIVDRTNYVLETATFGEMKQGERRRSGRKNLKQDLEHLPPAAAIARNLLHPDYVELVCGSLENLPDVFAELDAERRRKRLTEEEPPPSDPADNPIPEIASASLPADDRGLVRSEAMRRRVLAAARSRSPRTRVKEGRPGALATVQ